MWQQAQFLQFHYLDILIKKLQLVGKKGKNVKKL